MSTWGKVIYNPDRGTYAIRGKWKGKREYISRYPSAVGMKTCKTEHEIVQLQTIIRGEIDRGVFNPDRYKTSRPLTLEKVALSWLGEIKGNVSTGQYHNYESGMRLYIIPVLGSRFLPDIGHADLKELMAAMSHLIPKTKKNHMGALHRMLVSAQKDGIITQLPPWIEFTGANEVVRPPVKSLTVEAQLKILAAIPDKHRPIYLFMMGTGCRPSEARALRKPDIHPEDCQIWFASTFGYRGELKPVKQKKVMPVPITVEVQAILDIAPKLPVPWVFPNPDTGNHYGREINTIWNKGCDDAGVSRFPLYPSVRHSYAMQLLNLGVARERVSRLLRHSDLKTIEWYAEFQTATLEEDAGIVHRLTSCQHGANTDKENGTSD